MTPSPTPRRAKRRQADTSGDDYYVMPFGFCHGPGTSERSAHSYQVAALELPHIFCDGPDRANGMHQGSGIAGVTADGNRHFTYAIYIEHIELPGLKGQPIAVRCLQVESEGVIRLFADSFHPKERRHPGLRAV